MVALKYIVAHIIGSVLAASILALSYAIEHHSFDSFTLLLVYGMAPVFAVIGSVPATIVGAPALKLLLGSNLGPLGRFIALSAGGLLVGVLCDFGLGMKSSHTGAIAGGAIGLAQGIMFCRYRGAAEVKNAAS